MVLSRCRLYNSFVAYRVGDFFDVDLRQAVFCVPPYEQFPIAAYPYRKIGKSVDFSYVSP